MHLKHNEGKSVVLETFITTLKIKIYKYMASILKNVYVDKLGDTVDEYNNTYHRTIKMKPVDVKSGNYIEYNVNSNVEDPKFQVGDNVRIKDINWSKEVFVIKEVTHTVPWLYVISGLNGEKIIGTFYEK